MCDNILDTTRCSRAYQVLLPKYMSDTLGVEREQDPHARSIASSHLVGPVST